MLRDRFVRHFCFLQKKKVSKHATSAGRSSIVPFISLLLVLVASGGGGCALPRGVPESRYQAALALVDRGVVLLRERRFHEASASFEMAYDLAPLAAAVDGMGCSALVDGDLIRAEQLFRKAYSMDESYDEALANLALVLDLQGRSDEARALYRQALITAPHAWQARNNLIVLEYEQGAARMDVAAELRKAATLTQHGVVIDNVQRVEQGLQ